MIDYLSQFDFLYKPFNFFLAYPYAALIPAFPFLAAGCYLAATHRRHRVFKAVTPCVAALLWFCYSAWEFHVQREYPPESVPIRVDLLCIVPVLWGASLVALIVVALILAADCRSIRASERAQAPVAPL